MKHLFLNDSNRTLMVYYRPKDKVKLYECLIESTQDFWNDKVDMELIEYTISWLNARGFKVVDITKELKDTKVLRSHFTDNCFEYKGVVVFMNKYGLTFNLKGTLHSCEYIEQAINTIDKVIK